MLSKKQIIDRLLKLNNVAINNNIIDINGIKLFPYVESDFSKDSVNAERLLTLTLHLAWEILILEIYGLSLNSKNNVIIDVGMNIGVASIYFATLDSVIKVYGYEPVFENFNHAIMNIAANGLQQKIIPHNSGLFSTDSELIIPYSQSDNQRGSVINSTWEDYKNRNPNYNMQKIRVDSANRVLTNIIEDNPLCNVWIKLDAQGSEYAILESLSAENYLHIAGVFGEFHEQGVEKIIKILKDIGYVMHYKKDNNGRTGFFIAIRK